MILMLDPRRAQITAINPSPNSPITIHRASVAWADRRMTTRP
jgi:hypothetical protein